jgi:sterol desaturase/sphingolipid hydroxylase (fatty acid hydroxylase superfamily)
MFRVDWIERYLSRVKPWHVLLVWVPVTAWFAGRGLRDASLGPAAFALSMAGGLAFWTLLEYVLHRWVFHFVPSPDSQLAQDVHFLIHGVHHDFPTDADRLVMPPVVAALLAVLVGAPIRLVTGPHVFNPFFAGLLVGYLWYDMTHYAVHHLKPRTGLGKRLRRHHDLHHFKTPEARFGVSTPFWDYVFGTMPRDEKVAAEAG